MHVKDAQRIAGLLTFIAVSYVPARYFARTVYTALRGLSDTEWFKWSDDAREELMRWRSFVHGWNGSISYDPERVLAVFTDGALEKHNGRAGWGGHYLHHEAHGVLDLADYSAAEAKSSSFIEILAVTFTLQHFASFLRGEVVLVHTDSFTAWSYITKAGGKFEHLHCAVRRLWKWCLENRVELRAKWIPRSANKHADALSKLFY